MDIDSFFNFFNGIYCDYDGADGDQCFDLANNYSRWIGGPRFVGATADLIYNQAGTFYTQIPNTPDGVPQKGDIVVWSWPHVGVATGNNSNTSQFEVLEQNDPTNSNCHVKQYLNYNGVIGWLRPKQLPQNQQNTISQLEKARDDNWNLYQDELSKYQGISDQLAKAQIEINTLQQQLTDCQNKVQSAPVSEVTPTTTTPVSIPVTTSAGETNVSITATSTPEIQSANLDVTNTNTSAVIQSTPSETSSKPSISIGNRIVIILKAIFNGFITYVRSLSNKSN